MKKRIKIAIVVIILFALFAIIEISGIYAFNSSSTGAVNLIIYDTTDTENRFSNTNITFYANFTNSSGFSLNSTHGNGNCSIQFNFTGVFDSLKSMSYSESSLIWTYERTFNYKGNHSFVVNCTSDYGNISLKDDFIIKNTEPVISKTPEGYIDLDGNIFNDDYLGCFEDKICVYNFSANITDLDINDIFTFGVGSNTTLTNYTLNSSTGILLINITREIYTGLKQIELNVRDSESRTQTGILRVNITAVNDAPVFLNLNTSGIFNNSLFSVIIYASDEENDLPLTFNITSVGCTHYGINPPQGEGNCTPFNFTIHSQTSINITFAPSNEWEGQYIFNFTVSDSKGANTTAFVNWTFTWEDYPYFNYVCDNERNASEDVPFNCIINATDIDEIGNLTFAANYSWFLFNASGSSVLSTAGNGSLFTALVNFTPNDRSVGNFSIKINITDSSRQTNETSFYFYVANKDDSVFLYPINNIIAYTSSNYSFFVNVSDDDLLIPDKTVYNETFTFISNVTGVSAVVYNVIPGSNISIAKVDIDTNIVGNGSRYVNLSVSDRNNFSSYSRVFELSILGNTAPSWNESIVTNHTINESSNFYLNLTLNVTDEEGDTITFGFFKTNFFPSFSVDPITGIINFTPDDPDVGYHIVIINASDGKASSFINFTITVLNINDAPLVQKPISQGLVENASVSGNTVNTFEDNQTVIYLNIRDNDFRIPNSQKSFYNESLIINLNISGPNKNLFNFTILTAPSENSNLSIYRAVFRPNKSDVGNYNIIINVSDASNATDFIAFNLTITEINHAPSIKSIGNQTYSILETIFIDINATDLEDIDENFAGGNLTYSIVNLTLGGNFLNINESNGIINFTLSQVYAGVWSYSVYVTDTHGLNDSFNFSIFVYDFPNIIYPAENFQFNMKENETSLLDFRVNHTIGDNLNYSLIIRGIERNLSVGSGNGSSFLLYFKPNFTDETTCSGPISIALNVSNKKLSNFTTWNLTINHTNYPVTFYSNIGGVNPIISGGSPQTLTLSNYFEDIDATDPCVKQRVLFSHTLNEETGGSQSVTFVNWVNLSTPSVTFSSSESGTSNYTIHAFEFNQSQIIGNVSSNQFLVSLSIITTPVTTTGGGGGGSSITVKPVTLKLILPGPLTTSRKNKLVLPITVSNTGSVDLSGIILRSSIAKNNILRKDIISTFDNSFISLLRAGESKNVTLIVDVNAEETGIYEITVNGTSTNPVYSDWGKIFLNVEEGKKIEEKIFLIEELIAQNPECLEIKELSDKARQYYNEGDYVNSEKMLDKAINACKEAIAQKVRNIREREKTFESLLTPLVITLLASLALGFLYYYYKRYKLQRALMGY